MSGRQCPKCGSDQTLGDECLKCGVIISKAHRTSSMRDPLRPVSYVAPGAVQSGSNEAPAPSQPSYTYRPPATQVVIAKSKGHLERNIAFIVIAVLLAVGGYHIYEGLLRQVAVFGGYYHNTNYLFSMNFPKEGWSHYYRKDLKSLEFKEAIDAFYRGKDAENPDVLLAIWIEHVPKPVPERLSDEEAAKILDAIQQDIIERMQKTGMECEITDSSRQYLGGNHGFVIYADLKKDQLHMKTIIYCAFNQTRGFTIQFVGQDQHILANQKEIEKLMRTFTYKISII